MQTWRDAGRCTSPLVLELHGLWRSRGGQAGLPPRAAFDPLEMKGLLPNLLIVDLETEPFRARYRLVGTKVVAASGYDFTGRYLDEIELASGAEHWAAQYREVHASRLPLFGSADLPTIEGGRFTYEFGIFPVTTDGRDANQCLELEDYGIFNDRLYELQRAMEPWRPQPITAKKRPG